MRLSKPRLRTVTLATLLACGLAVCGASAMAENDAESAELRTPSSEGMQWLMDKLRQKERSLDHREATLAAREADLRLAEQKLEERLEGLKSLRVELEAQLGALDEARETRVVGLVRMFEGMRSKDAAAILSATETDIAIEVLERMSRMKAGKVLAEMEPAQAASLANLFASTPSLAASDGSKP
jgi:flagellar motility protein MotE (MotC chaperone)